MREAADMRADTKRLALCGIFAALALALLFLGGVVPFAVIACPVLASLVLLPVYAETGKKWSVLWYLTVAALAVLIAPNKEAAILFVVFGYYPMLRKFIGRIRSHILQWGLKILYVNATVFAAYSLMIFVLQLEALVQEFAGLKTYLLVGMMLLANASFVVYDLLIDRLEIYYHVKLRRKLRL